MNEKKEESGQGEGTRSSCSCSVLEQLQEQENALQTNISSSFSHLDKQEDEDENNDETRRRELIRRRILSEPELVQVRPMRTSSRTEVDRVLQIWDSIGLHEGLETISSFASSQSSADSESGSGFLVATLPKHVLGDKYLDSNLDRRNQEEEERMIVGSVAGVFIGQHQTGFIGLYAVAPPLQAAGIGIKMWRQLIQNHVRGRNVGLYAVKEQEAVYRFKAGFGIQDDPQMNMRVYESSSALDSSKLVNKMSYVNIKFILAPNLDSDHVVLDHNSPIELSSADQDLESAVCEYDYHVTGIRERDKLLARCFREHVSLSLCALSNYESPPRVLGYICIRANNAGKGMIGPLYANDDAVAEFLLFCACSAFKPALERGILFMPLAGNSGSIAIAAKMNLEFHEELPRYFTQYAPKAKNRAKIYCIHSPNFSVF